MVSDRGTDRQVDGGTAAGTSGTRGRSSRGLTSGWADEEDRHEGSGRSNREMAFRRARLCGHMREKATLKLDGGGEPRVEVDREDLDREEIVVRRATSGRAFESGDLIAVIDEHLATAERRGAGTTAQLAQADRERPY